MLDPKAKVEAVVAVMLTLAALNKATAPALPLLPIVTVPVDVPVLIDVLKLEEAFNDTAAPVTVNPAWPVTRPEKVGLLTVAMVMFLLASLVVVMFVPCKRVKVCP